MDLNSKKFFFAILLSVGALIFLFHLGARDLWDPDETRYAVVAREMRETGNWVLPQLNGNIYAEKPPLFFWLVNLSDFFLGEDSEFTNRLPSALAGLLTVFLTFLFGERFFNTRAGFVSGLALATCFFFPQISRWVMLDSLFTLLFLMTLYCFYLGFEKEEGRRKYYLFAGLCMGLGVLTKGPIAYLPLPIFVIFALFQKEMKKFWNRHLLLGFLLSLVVVFIWLIPACWLGGEGYTKRILFGQTVGRLAEGGKHFHPKSIFFYFTRFPMEFMPWTFFIPSFFLFGLKRAGEKRKEFLFLAIWFMVIFVFFTLSKGKKDNYLLPLYPAAALMMGILWDSGLDSIGRDKKLLIPLIFLTGVFLLIFIGVTCGIPDRFYPNLKPYYSTGLFISSYFLAGSLLSSFFFMKRRGWISFICLALTFTFFHLHLAHILPRELNGQRSMKSFSERVLKRMEAGDELKVCFFRPTGLYYYTKRLLTEEIWDQDRFQKVFSSSGLVFIVIQRGDLDQLRRELRIEIEPIDQERVGHWDLVLISN